MELLTSFLAGIFAFVGSIIGNVMANDLCVSAPRVCTFIIRRAVKRLGKHKGRYEEEWLADLAERETVYEKYNHAIGCLLGAGRIRTQARKADLHVIYIIPHFGPVEVTFNLNSRIFAPLFVTAIDSNYGFLRSCGWWVGILYCLAKFVIGVNRKRPGQMTQFSKLAHIAIDDKSIASWPFEVRLSKYGKTADFTKVGQHVAEQPSLVKFVYRRLREKKFIER